MNIQSNKTKIKSKIIVLFVCVENAGRSQMAEAFFKKYAPDDGHYEVTSAGTKHTSEINPIAVKAMSQIGIDISKQKPKGLNEDMIKNATKIINMGCMNKGFCPTLFINKVEDLGIEDPKGKPIEKVEGIRNQIESKIRELIIQLTRENKEE
ncbi:MAG TPA: arsenate reductase ArsC [Candidatus Nitrosocosmicus sp.]